MFLNRLLGKTDRKVFSLQLLQIIRAGAMFTISVFLAKIFNDTYLINQYETLLLIGSSFTFFWVSSLITTFLPFYYASDNKKEIIFNTFILLSLLSLVAFGLIVGVGSVAFSDIEFRLFWYYGLFILFNAPAYLTEYIFLIRGKYKFIVLYAIIVFSLQIVAVVLPLYFKQDLLLSVKFLALLGGIKYLFVFTLVGFNSKLKLDTALIVAHLKKSLPVAGAFILGGSAEYIDSYIVKYFRAEEFAIFRYGARELPFTLMFANALSNVLSGQIAELKRLGRIEEAFDKLKKSSARLMHFLFPLTIVLMLISSWLFETIYNETFRDAYKVFNIYLLLIVSRLVFPHSVALGLQKNHLILKYSMLSVAINIGLNFLLIHKAGIIGIAWATVVAHYFYKIAFILHLQQSGILLGSYVRIKPWIFYTLVTWALYFLM